MAGELVQKLADLQEDEALAIVRKRLDANDDPLAILDDVKQAMELVGKRFENKEYFIPDLVYSGEILNAITDIVKPRITGAVEQQKHGKVIVGTVAGDIHDIGKNIVTFMLDTNGFEPWTRYP